MELPEGGQNKDFLTHSAGLLVIQQPSPAIWQHHNANLQGAAAPE